MRNNKSRTNDAERMKLRRTKRKAIQPRPTCTDGGSTDVGAAMRYIRISGSGPGAAYSCALSLIGLRAPNARLSSHWHDMLEARGPRRCLVENTAPERVENTADAVGRAARLA